MRIHEPEVRNKQGGHPRVVVSRDEAIFSIRRHEICTTFSPVANVQIWRYVLGSAAGLVSVAVSFSCLPVTENKGTLTFHLFPHDSGCGNTSDVRYCSYWA